MNPSPVVHLAVCTDAGYAVQATVLLTSAKLNKHPESRYCVHVVQTCPCPGLRERLRELEAPDFEVCLQEVDVSHLERYRTHHRAQQHISAATFARLALCHHLPELEKVLYIDCDCLVLKDLSILYATPLGAYLLAACPEPLCLRTPHVCSVVGEGRYVQAGVLLMNLALMREENWPELMVRTLQTMPAEWMLMDQDAINHACHERILHLSSRYNYLALYYRETCTAADLNVVPGDDFCDWAEWDAAAVIFHMGGMVKPWNYVDAPASDMWMHYYHASPYVNVAWQRGLMPLPQLEEVQKVSLFGLLPLLRIRSRAGEGGFSKGLLFGFLPLWTLRRKAGGSQLRLFGFLPVLTFRGR